MQLETRLLRAGLNIPAAKLRVMKAEEIRQLALAVQQGNRTPAQRKRDAATRAMYMDTAEDILFGTAWKTWVVGSAAVLGGAWCVRYARGEGDAAIQQVNDGANEFDRTVEQAARDAGAGLGQAVNHVCAAIRAPFVAAGARVQRAFGYGPQ